MERNVVVEVSQVLWVVAEPFKQRLLRVEALMKGRVGGIFGVLVAGLLEELGDCLERWCAEVVAKLGF